MVRFRANPVIIEAYQFRGDVQVFPAEWLTSLMQPYAGQRVYLPSSVHGFNQEEGDIPRYSTHDAVDVGDWVYHDGTRLRKLTAGEFDRCYSEIRETQKVAADARWTAAYIGATDGSTPAQTSWLGYPWQVGRPVAMDNEAHARLVGANAHFVVVTADGSRFPPPDIAPLRPEEDPENAADDSTAGSASAAEAGRGDRGGSFGAGGYDDVDATADSGPSGPADGNPGFGGVPPVDVPRRGPGRPRREDSAGVRA